MPRGEELHAWPTGRVDIGMRKPLPSVDASAARRSVAATRFKEAWRLTLEDRPIYLPVPVQSGAESRIRMRGYPEERSTFC